jgi:hypothetical protein
MALRGSCRGDRVGDGGGLVAGPAGDMNGPDVACGLCNVGLDAEGGPQTMASQVRLSRGSSSPWLPSE